MKKQLFVFSAIVLANVLIATQAQAETVSNGSISLTDGSGQVTPPLDPTDPTNPNPTSPIDPADPNNNGTGNVGPLSIDYVSNFAFGEHKISGSDMTFYAKNTDPYVQVTDTRGTGAGWTVQASISEFASASKTSTLKGAQLTLKNPEVKSASQATTSEAPTGTTTLAFNASKQTVAISVKGAGKGTWLTTFPAEGGKTENTNVVLSVPAGSPEANTTYTATINWELLDAPK
ncbi:WxL domain-containing protein [Enterococcus ureasiticus]|uniref:WxL domain-containing protein n=1 Tax=Enterococcus ureasiticus TaxID=903984 RepID=UPI001A8D95AB|nr:WxL domain-containing protein [Enterococcus ureasiticus]MBO0473619.1 WxL domain-containing protein [Enterococcus ureasiticus]